MRSGPAERVRDREGVGVAAGVGVPLSSLALGLSICDGELRMEMCDSRLSWSVDEKSLSDAFSSFGEVTEVKIIYDKDSGRSRGFGFVQYLKEDDALSAKDAMDGKALLGRPLRITVAVDKARGGPVVVPRLSNMANGAGNDA
uniref:RRM domain-containing protein n=1 Tax=Cannabis sativa TaxID=3483 RepID=A0A803QJ63_CANSA